MSEPDTSERVNILMVDDQPAKLLSYEVILSDLGENLIQAGSAREALEQMLKHDIALVLLDVSMPELDGFELAAMIRQHPRFETTAIIFISAILHTDLDRIKGYQSGAVDYIPVPVVPELLRAKVRVFVDLYRKTRQLARMNVELEARVTSRTKELEETASRLRTSEVRLQQLLKQERAARAEAQLANVAKDEFLALVSHELRTPLNAILGWARLLQGERLDEPTTRRASEVIARNARSQARLVEDLLDFSRIASGRLRLDMQDMGLVPVISAAVELLCPSAESKLISIVSEFSVNSCHVRGDPERLKQVLANLLSNAVKFTPRGGRIEVRLEIVSDAAEVTISDTGQGIEPDFLPHVFEQFRQADAASTRRYDGLGLGLAIADHLVALHGGSIRAASEGAGKGASFTVRLPVIPASPASPASPARPFETSVPPLTSFPVIDHRSQNPLLNPVRALVVDDDADSRVMLAIALGQYNVEVQTAGSVAEAMEAFVRRPPDLLIADISMPEEDGYSLMHRIRALAPGEGGSVPAIALTAFARIEDRIRALDAGFQLHVAKPVDPAKLARIVDEFTGRPVPRPVPGQDV